MISIGEVISVKDYYAGERITVRVRPLDNHKYDDEIPYSFPLLPKMIHIKPKVGEAVFVIIPEHTTNTQRYYIGPIISQPQYMEKDYYFAGATTLLKGAVGTPDPSVNNIPVAIGAMANDNDVAIYGRKNTDIILTENDIRIRCGVRLTDSHRSDDTDKVTFNRDVPAFIKLKYFPQELQTYENNGTYSSEHLTTKSAVNIVGDKINLISPNGDPFIDVCDQNESINDEEMKKILTKCHKLPYGDVLVSYLHAFYEMFKSHTHKYANLPPCPDTKSRKFDEEYGMTNKKTLENLMLSKDIRIN